MRVCACILQLCLGICAHLFYYCTCSKFHEANALLSTIAPVTVNLPAASFNSPQSCGKSRVWDVHFHRRQNSPLLHVSTSGLLGGGTVIVKRVRTQGFNSAPAQASTMHRAVWPDSNPAPPLSAGGSPSSGAPSVAASHALADMALGRGSWVSGEVVVEVNGVPAYCSATAKGSSTAAAHVGSCAFAWSLSHTPLLLSADVLQQDGNGTTLLLSGLGLAVGEEGNTRSVEVRVVGALCLPLNHSWSSSLSSSAAAALAALNSSNATTATTDGQHVTLDGAPSSFRCRLPAVRAGQHSVQLWVPQRGYAHVPG
jgi:hypothetical protein